MADSQCGDQDCHECLSSIWRKPGSGEDLRLFCSVHGNDATLPLSQDALNEGEELTVDLAHMNAMLQ